MTRLVAFDLDGTLVDSRADIAASANAALSAVGLPRRHPDEVLSFVGEGARRLVERCVAPHGELLEPALEAWRAHYRAHLLDTTLPFPGIPEALDALAAHATLAVLTNKPGAFARAICDALFPGRFTAVLGPDDAAARKPAPDLLVALEARLGPQAAGGAYVGDTTIDLAFAAAAGLRFLGVGWGYGAAALPPPLVPTPAALVDALR